MHECFHCGKKSVIGMRILTSQNVGKRGRALFTSAIVKIVVRGSHIKYQ